MAEMIKPSDQMRRMSYDNEERMERMRKENEENLGIIHGSSEALIILTKAIWWCRNNIRFRNVHGTLRHVC
ncbi:hypothetical protein JHK85_007054 [Glycine max]|nr:hypothetical protein JHK85_007054 [Glycine max]